MRKPISYTLKFLTNNFSRLADWSSDDEVKPKRTSKWDHFVVIKNAFTLKEIEVRICP